MKGNLGSIETKAIHAGEPRPRIAGAVVMPVFQSATYQYAGEKNYDDVRYIRLNNTPNHLALAGKLSALENAEDAIVTASGMAGIYDSQYLCDPSELSSVRIGIRPIPPQCHQIPQRPLRHRGRSSHRQVGFDPEGDSQTKPSGREP